MKFLSRAGLTISLAAVTVATSALCQTSAPTPPAAASPAVSKRGSDLFAQHCAVCHDPAIEGAPDASAFETFPPPFIVQALKSGDMKPMATGLSDEDINAIAAYLSGQ